MDFSSQEILEQRKAWFKNLQAAEQRNSKPPVPPQHKEGLMPCTFPATCPVHANHTAAYGSYLELPKYGPSKLFSPVLSDDASSAYNTAYTPSTSEATSHATSDWSFLDPDETEDPLKEKYRQDVGGLMRFRYTEDGAMTIQVEEENEFGQQEGQGHPTNIVDLANMTVQERRDFYQKSCAFKSPMLRWDRYIPGYGSESDAVSRRPSSGEISRSEGKRSHKSFTNYDDECGVVHRSPSPGGTSISEERGWDRYVPNYDDDSRRPDFQRHHHRAHHRRHREEEKNVWDTRYDENLSKHHQIRAQEARQEVSKIKATTARDSPVVDNKQPSKPRRRYSRQIGKTRSKSTVRKGNRSVSKKPYKNSRLSHLSNFCERKEAETNEEASMYIKISTTALTALVVYVYWRALSEICSYKLNILIHLANGNTITEPITVIWLVWSVNFGLALLLCSIVVLICQVISMAKDLLEDTEVEE